MQQPAVERWVVGVFLVSMSFWYFLSDPASPETPASCRKHQLHQHCPFGDGGIPVGTRAVAGLAEYAALQVTCRRSAIHFEADDIVGAIDHTVRVKIAG